MAALSTAVALGPGCVARPEPTRAPVFEPAPRPGGWRVVPIGLCEDYPEESRSIPEVQRDVEVLRESGARVLRVSIGWDGVEPQDDRFDFAFWDAFFATMEKRGIVPLPYVAYTPAWAVAPTGSEGEGDSSDSWKQPPRDPRAFGQVMETLARRYRGRVQSWELWNEPDNRDYWLGSAAEFAALVREGARGVRRGDPQARVVLGGIAGRVPFLDALFSEHAIAPFVDVVNVHAYFETWHPDPIERLPEYLDAVAQTLRESGSPRPIWLAEFGYSSQRKGAHVSAVYQARFAYEHTPAFQAVALGRMVTLALASPHVTLLAWYEVKDLPPAVDVIGDVNNRHLGVTLPDHRPKPALASLRFFTRLFGAGFRPLPDPPVRREPDSIAAETFAFELPEGVVAVMTWIPTQSKGTGHAALAEDDRRVAVQVTVPCPGAAPSRLPPGPSARRFDERGQPIGSVPVGQLAGAVSLGPLSLEAGELAVTLVTGCSTTRAPLGTFGPVPR